MRKIFNIHIEVILSYSECQYIGKVRADFERKLKRRFKFLISFIKFKSFAARTFRTTQYFWNINRSVIIVVFFKLICNYIEKEK